MIVQNFPTVEIGRQWNSVLNVLSNTHTHSKNCQHRILGPNGTQ